MDRRAVTIQSGWLWKATLMGKLPLTKLLVAEMRLCADNASAIAKRRMTRRLPGETLSPIQR
jgi:hypothetical protein